MNSNVPDIDDDRRFEFATRYAEFVRKFIGRDDPIGNAFIAGVSLILLICFAGTIYTVVGQTIYAIAFFVSFVVLLCLSIAVVWAGFYPGINENTRRPARRTAIGIAGVAVLAFNVTDFQPDRIFREVAFVFHYVRLGVNAASVTEFVDVVPNNPAATRRVSTASDISSLDRRTGQAFPAPLGGHPNASGWQFLKLLTETNRLVVSGHIDLSASPRGTRSVLAAKSIEFENNALIEIGAHDLIIFASEIKFGSQVEV